MSLKELIKIFAETKSDSWLDEVVPYSWAHGKTRRQLLKGWKLRTE